MRSVKEADAMRVHGGVRDEQARRTEEAPETAARQRLTLRHLHGLIETIREEHMKLEMRVDRLSELVDRMTEPDAGMRREAIPAGSRTGESRSAALPELPLDAGAAFGGRLNDSGGRGAAKPGAAEDRAAFGFAIWAGVERAIGNAAVMLAAESETGAGDADRSFERTSSAVQPTALSRRQPPAEHGQHEVPIESLLLELREAARIADEIAANASAAEHRESTAHPARAPDAAGRDAGMAAPQSADPEPDATGGAIAGPHARDASAGAALPEVAAAAETAAPEAGSEMAADGDGGPQTTRSQPAEDASAILIPRSERHRVRKKRSLWARLFRRHHADL